MPGLTIDAVDNKVEVALSNLRTLHRRAQKKLADCNPAEDEAEITDLQFEVDLLEAKIRLLESYVNYDA